jgi:hypothetical protein
VLYVPFDGDEQLGPKGRGWCNMSEARKACDIAQHLLTECGVAQRDITIMSPFNAQLAQIRGMMRADGYYPKDDDGPQHSSRGSYNRVVILCTTRTSEILLQEDIENQIGVIGLKRQMNYALTRVEAALFVLGCPTILAKDEHWRAFLAFCWRNGLVQGAPFDGEMVKSFQGYKVGSLEKALRPGEAT